MFRTTAASLLALATAIFPAGAQTVLYGEPSVARPVFPQPQPYYGEPQPVQQTQPLYYEAVPAPQPQQPALPPPAIYEPEPEIRQFRPIPQPGVTQTRPLAPVEQYRPPRPEVFVGPSIQQQPRPVQPAPPPPVAEAPRFAPAEPEMTESEALTGFSEELSRIVALGERYRAASPGFLDDLRALAEKYRALPVRPDAMAEASPDDPDGTAAPDEAASPEVTDLIGPPPPAPAPDPEASPADAPSAEEGTGIAMLPDAEPEPAPAPEPAPEPEELPQALPPTSASIVYLRDDFSDGDYLSNPAWNVRQGQFTIDPAYGLRPFTPEATAAPQVTPQALLQYLIGEGEPQAAGPAGDTGASLIEVQTDIGNAFSMVATITDHGGEGAAHFILHQGGANWLGYRLELRAGPRPLVVLARRGSSGYKDIMKVEAPGFTTGKPHQLRWARLSDGQMFVLIDGRPIITARDTVFRQNWTGFAYFTADADVSMRNIRIAEPVER